MDYLLQSNVSWISSLIFQVDKEPLEPTNHGEFYGANEKQIFSKILGPRHGQYKMVKVYSQFTMEW